MMTGAIDRKRRGMIKSLKEAKMIKVEGNGSAPKIQIETVVAKNARNVVGTTKILAVVTRLAVTIARKIARREMKEGAMAEVLIGIGLLRHLGDSTISMEILWWQIEIEGVNEVEINMMNRVMGMGGMAPAPKTGDLRWEETAAQGMGPIGDLRWEEMVTQTIDVGTMIEEDNQSSASATLLIILIYTAILHVTLLWSMNYTRFYARIIKIRTFLHQDKFKFTNGCCFIIAFTFSRYHINKLSYLFLFILDIFLARYSIT
mmetsp:Transcript_14443/g.24210  ORF Transcript_14443/g.24210 Transcript_14443/m.24210 type:complete len:260 (+) Transcript_14443:643-1422(+)